jgi:hypothetical protein
VIPHGDRRDGAQSGRVEHEKMSTIERQHHVVRVLVLRDDLSDLPRRLLLACPLKDVGERMTGRERPGDARDELWRDAPDGCGWYGAHAQTTVPRGR